MRLERVRKYLSNGTKTIVQLKGFKLLRHLEVFGFKKEIENFEIFMKILRIGKVNDALTTSTTLTLWLP